MTEIQTLKWSFSNFQPNAEKQLRSTLHEQNNALRVLFCRCLEHSERQKVIGEVTDAETSK